jgi:hypothetical protein
MDDKSLKIEISPAKLRGARGTRSPGEVARMLGISYQYLHMIESGKRNVPSSVLVKMCKLYAIENILELTDDSEKFLRAA